MAAPARILVLLPHGARAGDASIGPGVRVMEWHGADDVMRALVGLDDSVSGVVLMSDGLDGDALAGVVAAVEAMSVPVVEVRGEQWDGFSTSPLASVCKGVVSGFGVEGAFAAARALALALA